VTVASGARAARRRVTVRPAGTAMSACGPPGPSVSVRTLACAGCRERFARTRTGSLPAMVDGPANQLREVGGRQRARAGPAPSPAAVTTADSPAAEASRPDRTTAPAPPGPDDPSRSRPVPKPVRRSVAAPREDTWTLPALEAAVRTSRPVEP